LEGYQREPLDQLVPVADVDLPLNPRQQVKRLRTRQRRPQVRLAGDIGQPAMSRDRLPLAIEAEDLGPTTGRSDQAE
jgi:hypothetical protein